MLRPGSNDDLARFRSEIGQLGSKTKQPHLFDQLYDLVHRGLAHVWVAPAGLAVVSYQGKSLLVWVAINHGDSSDRSAALEDLQHFARDIGADGVVFHTHRPGWLRVMPKGWTSSMQEDGSITWRKSV